jgi:hypothetical protein
MGRDIQRRVEGQNVKKVLASSLKGLGIVGIFFVGLLVGVVSVSVGTTTPSGNVKKENI